MSWSVPKLWKNDECWIIGGGTSIPHQFNIPKKLVKEVCSGEKDLSYYKPYLKILENKNTIGVNNSYLLGEKIVDISFFGDTGWFKKHKDALKKRNMLTVTCSLQPETLLSNYGVKFLDRIFTKKYGISTKDGYVCWNNNSGAAAISMAYLLGVKKIYLLGFDMYMEDEVSHWHPPHFGNTYKVPPFHKHLEGFKHIAEDAEKLGLEIINVSPNSRIKQFPKVSLKDIV